MKGLVFFWALAATGVGFAQAETARERKARILAPTTDFTKAEPFEALQGGSGTNTERFDSNAFSLPSGTLGFAERSDFFIGNGVFDRPWVVAPASTLASDGLGPLYNARSCQGCHIKDGRGHPPEPGDVNLVSMIFSLSGPDGGPDPRLGHQFQDQAIAGYLSEGRVAVDYTDHPFTYPDGTKVVLRKPRYTTDAALAPETSLNPRVAPPMIGLGLIEAIADEDLIRNADPLDQDGDGVSGRVAYAGTEVGRFGWKAMAPDLRQQSANAFLNDMGLSTSLQPDPWGDCTAQQTECQSAPHGNPDGGTEIADDLLDLVAFYSAHLAVPARRDMDQPEVLHGKAQFYAAGCIACHVPKFATCVIPMPQSGGVRHSDPARSAVGFVS
ncbi:MAG: di-heme oxidoredictase family protein, partial [Pseudomonadota bacterium]